MSSFIEVQAAVDYEDWEYYGDDKISSIYLSVYNRLLQTSDVESLKQHIIDKMREAVITRMVIAPRERYDSTWAPKLQFFVTIPGEQNSYKTDVTGHDGRINIRVPIATFFPPIEKTLSAFTDNVGEDGCKIHMHGLMNLYSVKNGTKGGKNKLPPWLMNKLGKSPEVQKEHADMNARLSQECYKFISNPEYNAKYIEERNKLGKQGVVEQLKSLKHLPLEVIKEALNEFLCMDVMDDFDE